MDADFIIVLHEIVKQFGTMGELVDLFIRSQLQTKKASRPHNG